ncbi:MAG: hypothetical protein ACRD2R_08975, partial [Terriglobales bacterium]
LRVLFDRSSARARLLGLYGLLAASVGFYTTMAPGASVNALLETWMICSLLAPFALDKILEKWSVASPPLRATLLLLVAWTFGLGLDAWRTEIEIGRPPGFGQLAAALEGKEYLSDNAFLAAQARTPEMLDPSVNHYLELAGRWSPGPIVEKLRAQRYEAIVLGLDNGRLHEWRGYPLFSRTILKEVGKYYEVGCTTDRVAVLLPVHEAAVVREEILGRLHRSGCREVDPASATRSIMDFKD